MTIANNNKVVALPSIDKNAVGAIVYWRLSGDTNYEKLCNAWKEAGLDEDLLPKLPSPRVALQRACEELARSNKLKRLAHPSKEKTGWTLVGGRVDAQNHAVFEEECYVDLDANKELVIEPPHHPGCESVERSFKSWQTRLASIDMGTWLAAKVVGHVKAVSLRDSGGVYFIPRDEVQNFETIREVIHHASSNRCFEIPAVKGEEALDAVLDAIIRDAEAEAKAIEEDLARVPGPNGELPLDAEGNPLKPLGARALRSRAKHCDTVTSKIEIYEELLDTRLDQMRERLESLQASAVEAAVLAENQKGA